MPACAVPLVGREQRATCSASAPTTCCAPPCRCSTSTRSTPSRRPRSPAAHVGVRAALLGLGLLAGDARARRDRGLPARRDGADPAGAAGGRRRARRIACASGSAPACRRRPARRSSRAPASRCSKATARPRPTSSSPPRPIRRARGVMGWLQPGFDARVVDEDDVELPAGDGGRAAAARRRAVRLRQRLFRHAGEDRRGLAQPLVPHRRPRGARADGAFRFVDRIKDAIRRRGENISSFEVEQVLLSHPAVAGVAVYPVRSELAEDEVMAALVARDGRALDPAELLALLRAAPAVLRGAALSSTCWPTCRAPRTARCRSTSCASAA